MIRTLDITIWNVPARLYFKSYHVITAVNAINGQRLTLNAADMEANITTQEDTKKFQEWLLECSKEDSTTPPPADETEHIE